MIGTVLPAIIGDEVRVTVVATGLNQSRAKAPRPVLVDTPMPLARTGTDHALSNDVFAPAGLPGGFGGLRRASGRTEPTVSSPATALSDGSGSQSYLDIPSFLRRQAD